MSWLDAVIEATDEFESPRRFNYWSALSAISAVLKDSVWIDKYRYKLYPNIYVLLYGPSGIRKGPPIAMAESIVKKVDNTRVINGRSSIEAIIKELGTVYTRPGKPLCNDGAGFVVASELSSSIIANPASMDVMTALYDRMYMEDDWKYKLKVGESVKISKPTVTWLSGTNEAMFKDFIPEKNIAGGLIGRMLIITETKRNRLNSLMYKPEVYLTNDQLAEGLKPIAELRGEFTLSTEVRAAVNTWYIEFVTNYADKMDDTTGFIHRVDDMILKIAMIISSGRRADKQITIDDVTEATEQVLPLIVPSKRVAAASNKFDPSMNNKRALIITELANSEGYKATRTHLLKKFGLSLDHEDLDRIVSYLIAAEVMKSDNHAGIITYKLNESNEKVRNWMEQYKK